MAGRCSIIGVQRVRRGQGAGRGLERSDRKAVKAIAERVAKDGYHFSALVLEIVRSDPFQMTTESWGAR